MEVAPDTGLRTGENCPHCWRARGWRAPRTVQGSWARGAGGQDDRQNEGLSDRELSGPHAEDEDGGQSPTLSSGLAGTRAPRGLTWPCHTTCFQDTV